MRGLHLCDLHCWMGVAEVSSLSFSMILGSFLIYFTVILRCQRDERATFVQPLSMLNSLLNGVAQASSSSFSMILGSFLIYSTVILRCWRDERVAFVRPLPMSTSLLNGGCRRGSLVQASSSSFSVILGSFLIYFTVVLRCQRDKRCSLGFGFRFVSSGPFAPSLWLFFRN